ncbi:hypothetical protein C0991_007810 [Blastosporella zonata]|nr:hypothetical protein C0991_007810 [Blastosporella zonata]
MGALFFSFVHPKPVNHFLHCPPPSTAPLSSTAPSAVSSACAAIETWDGLLHPSPLVVPPCWPRLLRTSRLRPQLYLLGSPGNPIQEEQKTNIVNPRRIQPTLEDTTIHDSTVDASLDDKELIDYEDDEARKETATK